MHQRIQIPATILDPLPFLSNTLPARWSRSYSSVTFWILHWPTICTILHVLDFLYHAMILPPLCNPGQRLLDQFPLL